jgi:PAS domain S-box-containing protein
MRLSSILSRIFCFDKKEIYYRALFQESIGIAIWDKEEISWSPHLEAIYGLPKGKFRGTRQAFLEFVLPDYIDLVTTTIDRAFSERSGYTIQFQVMKASGEIAWLKSTGSFVKKQGRWCLLESVRDISSERGVQECFIENEKRWRAIVKDENNLLIEVDQFGLVTYASNSFLRRMGYQKRDHEVIGKPLLSLVYPTDKHLVVGGIWENNQITEIQKNGTQQAVQQAVEFRYLHADGTWVYFEAVPSLLQENNEVILTLTEITKEKHEQSKIQEYTSLLTTILESTLDGIVTINNGAWITHFNKQFLKMWNVPEDLMNQGNDRLLVNFMKGQLVEPDLFQQQIESEYEDPVLNDDLCKYWELKDGRIFERCSKPLYYSSSIVGRVISYRDVSHRMSGQANLKTKNQFLQGLLDNLPGAVYRGEHTVDWGNRFMTSGIEQITGYPSSAFCPKGTIQYSSLMHPDDRPIVYEMEKDAVAQKRPYELKYRIIHRDGRIRWVCERAQGMYGEDGSLMHIDGIIFDITEQKRLEETLSLKESSPSPEKIDSCPSLKFL